MKQQNKAPIIEAEHNGKEYALWTNGKWTHRPDGGECLEVTDDSIIAALDDSIIASLKALIKKFEDRKTKRAARGKKSG